MSYQPTIQYISQAVKLMIDSIAADLEAEHLSTMFRRAFYYTLESTIQLRSDGTVFVLTGDIPAMWLRDSSWQVVPYIRYCRVDAWLKQVVRGVILRQAHCICLDPYANAFTRSSKGGFGFGQDVAQKHPGVWERKFEIDSLICPLMLMRRYVEGSGDIKLYRQPIISQAIHTILTTLSIEQRHNERSHYSFRRPLPGYPHHDTELAHSVDYTGLIWSAFRPSDDGCVYNYHIPSQMFALVELSRLNELIDLGQDVSVCRELVEGLRNGIDRYGVVDDVVANTIFAFEVDGRGRWILMDDANLPSLLGLPLLQYCAVEEEIYVMTRKVVLSPRNPYYFAGEHAMGIGSPHTPPHYIWPLSLVVEAMTCTNPVQAQQLLHLIADTSGETGLVHESFNSDAPGQFTRPYFAWGNALFAEAVHQVYRHS